MSRSVALVRSDSDNECPMQAPASIIRENDVDCGIANIPCCFGQRERFQRLATSGRFFFVFVLLSVLMSLIEGYVYSSAKLLNSTFKYPPAFFDLLVVGNGLFQGLVAFSVSYWGNRIHRPAWLGGLTCLLGAFCIITIIPYVDPKVQSNNVTNLGPRLCAREATQVVSPEEELEGGEVMMVTVAMLLAFLSLANVSYWSHGLTYLDDSIEPEKSATFIGSFLGLRLTMVNNGYSILGLVAASPSRWWIPFLVFGLVAMLIGVVIICFPLRLLSTIVNQTAASILDMASGNSNENLDNARVTKRSEEFWPTLKRIATNKIIVLDTLALSLFALAICNFDVYENAFLQAQYHIPYTHDLVDPWTSRQMAHIFKTVLIILLNMVAGLSFARVQGLKKMGSFVVMMGVNAVIVYISFVFLDCKTGTIIGEEGTRYLTPLCSHDCRCLSSEVVFEPVCIIEGSQTYFSPCHAGCTTSAQINNIFVYGNCSCGPHPEYLLGSGPLTSATRGACSANDCFSQWIVFQVFYILNIAAAASTLVAHLLIALRSVRPSDKAAAVGFMLTGVGVVAYLPGHFIYKGISEATCHYWNVDSYNCNLHGPKFADILAGVSAGIVFLSVVVSSFVLKMIKNKEAEEDKKVLHPVSEDERSADEVDDAFVSERTNGEVHALSPLFRTTRI